MPSQKAEQEKQTLKLVEMAGKIHKTRIYDVESKPSFLKVYIDNVPPFDLNPTGEGQAELLGPAKLALKAWPFEKSDAFKPPPHCKKNIPDGFSSKMSVQTCEKFMKTLLFLLESEGLNNRECEVSTPGLERFLRKDWHYHAAVGQTIRVTTFQRVWTGRLYKYQDRTLFLDDGVSKQVIPLNTVKKARTVFKSQKKKIRRKKYEHDK